MEPEVRAAGGIVTRNGRVLVVHRPKYDDWSLPKGKLEPGETWEDAAVREVAEETGLHGELGEHVGTTRYTDHRGREKEVRWFRIEAGGEPTAQNEVDEVRWANPEEAERLLSYERDRELLSRLR